MDLGQKDKTDLVRTLAGVGLTQADLARLLAVDKATVNRWAATTAARREDALPVPQYARAFLLAYSELTPAQREGIWAQLS